MGRLVGYVEMKKGPANQTALDIPPAFRNDVLRSKRVLVGCGGGFHQECQQPYSPVASWMEDADVALNDEGQQYGNLDECENHARKMRTFFTRRLEPKTKSSNAFKWSLRPQRK